MVRPLAQPASSFWYTRIPPASQMPASPKKSVKRLNVSLNAFATRDNERRLSSARNAPKPNAAPAIPGASSQSVPLHPPIFEKDVHKVVEVKQERDKARETTKSAAVSSKFWLSWLHAQLTTPILSEHVLPMCCILGRSCQKRLRCLVRARKSPITVSLQLEGL